MGGRDLANRKRNRFESLFRPPISLSARSGLFQYQVREIGRYSRSGNSEDLVDTLLTLCSWCLASKTILRCLIVPHTGESSPSVGGGAPRRVQRPRVLNHPAGGEL